jgi:hypothetical protein
MFSQGERRCHGTEYSCNCSARSNELLMKYLLQMQLISQATARWNTLEYQSISDMSVVMIWTTMDLWKPNKSYC